MTDTEFAKLYADLCNVICRFDLNISDDDPFSHTSDVARAVVNRIIAILEDHGLLSK